VEPSTSVIMIVSLLAERPISVTAPPPAMSLP
jgi:hypothetical protein